MLAGLRRGASLGLSVAVTLGVVALGHAPVRAEEAATGICGAPIAPEDSDPKQINLVLDDSGSMFHEDKGTVTLDRWSKAKYALEIFAALMGPNDSLRVYRLSDFTKASESNRPILDLQGSDGAQANAAEINDMVLRGKRTPFLAVEEAVIDLESSSAPDKWLVVVTDGEFELAGREKLDEAGLNQRLKSFVEKSQGDERPIKIAYLSIGEGVPTVDPNPGLGIYAEQAPDANELLLKMNELADQVFQRDKRPLDPSGVWQQGEDAVDMEQMIVFAQGTGVSVGSTAETTNGAIEGEVVDVRWSENPDVVAEGVAGPIDAVPDQTLQGQVAFFRDVPRGDVSFSIRNADDSVPVLVFYKPKVTLGYRLLNVDGTPVVAGDIPAGEYVLEFGVMDASCNFVNSSLLGNPDIQATLTHDGEVIAEGIKSGETIKFPKGDVEFDLFGTYLDNVPIANPEPLKRAFLPPPLPSQMAVLEQVEYKVSEMAEYPPLEKQIPLTFTVVEDGVERTPTIEEWASLDPASFTLEPGILDHEVVKGETPGDLRLLVRAPEGDIYNTEIIGEKDYVLTGSYLPSQTSSATQVSIPIKIENDISMLDRLVNWFKEIGWKILLALLLLAILLGYIFKRRFSKRVNRRPSISGTPKTVGMTAIEDRGKFQVNGFRRFLPFVANTATLSYVPPGTTGFRTLKLKAGPGRSMIVTNWKEIAEKDNVEINGTPINSETRRAPKFGAGGTISASTPQMTFELSPGN